MFVVLQKQFAHIESALLSGVFRDVLKLNKINAQARAKNTQPGMVAFGVSHAEAAMMAQQLGDKGIETATISMQDVKPLPKDVKTIKAGNPLVEGFEAIDMYGRGTLIPWSDCLLYSAGVISEEFRVAAPGRDSNESGEALRFTANVVGGITLATVDVGVFFGRGYEESAPEQDELETKITQQMELITVHPDLRRVRIRANQFIYSCLKEQMADNAKVNFRLLAMSILGKGAEHFAFDPQLIEYVENPAQLPAFDSEVSWNAYNFWQLQMY